MTHRPRRSAGVLVAALGDAAVAHDLVTETLHHLNASAGAVLVSCDGRADVDGLAAAVAGGVVDAGKVRGDVARIVDTFAGLGLVDRDVPFVPPEQVPDAPGPSGPADDPGVVARTIVVLDRSVTFRGPSGLVDDVVDHVGLSGRSPDAATVVIVLIPDDSGDVDRVVLDPPAHTDGRPVGGNQTRRPMGLHERIASSLNRFAAATDTCLALHTGGVRLPDGRVVLVPAASGSGKSTLTAALVAADCDLLGDEIVGLDLSRGSAIGYPRRISLDGASRRALGLPPGSTPERDGGVDPAVLRADVERLSGTVGPVAAVVSPRFVADGGFDLERLDVAGAFDQLLVNTLNLARVGQPGLEVLCHVAESAASYRLTHGDAPDAARRLLDVL